MPPAARVIVSDDQSPDLDINPTPMLLIGAAIRDSNLGWHAGSKGFTTNVGIKRSDFSDWITKLAVDIYIANSQCVEPIVISLSKSHSLEDFYSRKVKFSREINASSSIGPISNNAGYVALSALKTDNQGNLPWKRQSAEAQALIAIRNWDNFILSNCQDFLPSIEEAVQNLGQRKDIGGQLSKRRLLATIPAGAGILAVYQPKLRQARNLAAEVASAFSTRDISKSAALPSHQANPDIENQSRELSIIPFRRRTRNAIAAIKAPSLWEGHDESTSDQTKSRKKLLKEHRVHLERYYAAG